MRMGMRMKMFWGSRKNLPVHDGCLYIPSSCLLWPGDWLRSSGLA